MVERRRSAALQSDQRDCCPVGPGGKKMFRGADFPRLGNAIAADCCRLTWSQGRFNPPRSSIIGRMLQGRDMELCKAPLFPGRFGLFKASSGLLEFLTRCRSPVCWGLEGVQATEHALSEICGLE